MTFFITENMIGNDCQSISRCWDLKGSVYNRRTKPRAEQDDCSSEDQDDNGFTVYKDLNLLE